MEIVRMSLADFFGLVSEMGYQVVERTRKDTLHGVEGMVWIEVEPGEKPKIAVASLLESKGFGDAVIMSSDYVDGYFGGLPNARRVVLKRGGTVG